MSLDPDFEQSLQSRVRSCPVLTVSWGVTDWYSEENLGDLIEIRVDVVHLTPVDVVVFPATTVVRTLAQHGKAIRGIQEHLLGVPIQEELTALRFKVDVAEAENASLRAMIRTIEEIEMVMMIVAFREHWLRSLIWLFLTKPNSVGPANVLPLVLLLLVLVVP
nr:hypothetical protein [Tanacetum cinerariifolium]